MNVVGAFTTGGRGWNRTIGVSCVTGLQPAAFAARRTRPYKSVGFFLLYTRNRPKTKDRIEELPERRSMFTAHVTARFLFIEFLLPESMFSWR